MIRYVNPEEWETVVGKLADMLWIVTKERFVSFFDDPRRGLAQYEYVEKNHGCNAWNAASWAVAMNSMIDILNTVPHGATEADVIKAFGL